MSDSKIIINNIKVKIVKENDSIYYRIDDIYKILDVKRIQTLKSIEKSIKIKKFEDRDYIDHYDVLKLFHHYKIEKEIHDIFLQSIYDTNYYIHPISEQLGVLNKPGVYILQLKHGEYKYGKTEDIKSTMDKMKTIFKEYKIKPKMFKYWSCNKITTTNCVEEITFHIEQTDYSKLDKYKVSKVIKTEHIHHLIKMIDNYVAESNYNINEISKLKHKIEEMKKLTDEYVRTIEILKRNKEIQQIAPEKIHILDDQHYKCQCGSVLKKTGEKNHKNSHKHTEYMKTHQLQEK